jgi:1-carboxybiuret hydrolase
LKISASCARYQRRNFCARSTIHTQPISFIGLPVVAVPVPLEPLPIGVQIIAAPWREDIALRVAYALEKMGVAAAPAPRGL